MLNNKQLQKILKTSKIFPEDEIKELAEKAKKVGKSIEEFLISEKIITSKTLYKNAASFFKMSFVELGDKKIEKETLKKINEPIANTHKIISFEENENELKIATSKPNDLEIFEFLKKKIKKPIKIYLTTPEDINKALKFYHKNLKSDLDFLEDIKKQIRITNYLSKGQDLAKAAEDVPIVKIVDTLVKYAAFRKASDIHIEPQEKDIIVRYRIDGILHDIITLPKSVQAGILARIKILANLKVDEHRIPQDGRFKIVNDNNRISFRVSTIPIFDGEKIVMRLLDEKNQILYLEQLGFQPDSLEKVKRNVKKSHGMILATGPTGSGKTTTLYTLLNMLNTENVNISTIEDPIEYRISRINQSQVNHRIGFTFALGLRALLRQDPDIIMVGEIRDEETAEIAIHAAMTGHLVLSTLHTNDSVGTLARLSNMGIPPFLIADTTNLIIAQRLVRKICPHCIQSYKLKPQEIQELESQFNMKEIMKTMVENNFISRKQASLKNILFYRGKGCSKCDQTGYKGRIGIYETLEITEEISELILKKESAQNIKKKAVEQGMITILEDGFIKAKNGITTIEEIIRVTKE